MIARRIVFCTCLALACALAPAFSALAADVEPSAPKNDAWNLDSLARAVFSDRPSIKARGWFEAESDFSDHGGAVAMHSAGAQFAYAPFSASYDQMGFEWSDTSRIPFTSGGDTPFERFHRLALSLSQDFPVTGDWYGFVGLTGTSAFEEQMDGSYGGAFRLGGAYAFSKALRVSFGAAAFVNNVEWRVLPFAGVRWDNRGQDGLGFFASLGVPTTEIGYRVLDDLAFRLEGTADHTFYRLRDDSPVERKGYTKISEYALNFWIDWDLTHDLALTFGPTFAFGRSIKVYDSGGEHQSTHDLDSAFGGRAELKYKF